MSGSVWAIALGQASDCGRAHPDRIPFFSDTAQIGKGLGRSAHLGVGSGVGIGVALGEGAAAGLGVGDGVVASVGTRVGVGVGDGVGL